jgi:hypothetical protein
MTKITSQQSNSGRNIIRFILLQKMTRQPATQTVLSWRINTRAPLYAIMRQRKLKRHNTPKELPAYENITKAIYSFMNSNHGPAERTFEEMITTSPISAQHTPWHGETLTGNEIERLLEYVEWVFSTLKSLTTTDENLSKELSEKEEVWDCFAKMVPLLRSTIFLEITERTYLTTYI